MCGKCGAAWTVSSSCEHFGTVGALVECLDLSPPDVVDGVPVRLDALPWALDVLGAWLGVEFMTGDDYRIHRQDVTRTWGAWTWGPNGAGYRQAVAAYAEVPPTGDDDADGRAVVAAVLRKGRPKVQS
jgi:hypothetical protein